MAYPLVIEPTATGDVLLADVLWKNRALDVWVQVALIFSGVLGVLGLLSEKIPTHETQKDETQVVVDDRPTAIQIEQEVHV
jgi:hypothetical protein